MRGLEKQNAPIGADKQTDKQIDKHPDGHGDSMTESAQWGRFSANKKNPKNTGLK